MVGLLRDDHIYEMHVRGFTRHPSSGVTQAKRGTYACLIEKIPYLADLGVSAVELLPVFAFDEQDGPPGLGNYWGYQPLSFFAPHDGYSSRSDPLGAIDELRDMVKALHRAGIEIILDVVYNHTAEGSEDGPTICFRDLANNTYYILAEDKSRYADYTGCGNTLNANEPTSRKNVKRIRASILTCHDGFTLNDLVSFNSKHNVANGEGNRDGADSNLSWNCGIEGPTADPERLRNRQVKNFLTLTLLAIGTPMLLMGDDVERRHEFRAERDQGRHQHNDGD